MTLRVSSVMPFARSCFCMGGCFCVSCLPGRLKRFRQVWHGIDAALFRELRILLEGQLSFWQVLCLGLRQLPWPDANSAKSMCATRMKLSKVGPEDAFVLEAWTHQLVARRLRLTHCCNTQVLPNEVLERMSAALAQLTAENGESRISSSPANLCHRRQLLHPSTHF